MHRTPHFYIRYCSKNFYRLNSISTFTALFKCMSEEQKKNIEETLQVIQSSLELLQKEGKIGTCGFGTRSYEQGAWDPKKKKTFTDYVKAVLKLRALGSNHPFKFGFTLICFVQNPQNTIQIELIRKEYKAKGPYFHYTDFINYDEFMIELDGLAKIIGQLDLRKLTAMPANKKIMLN